MAYCQVADSSDYDKNFEIEAVKILPGEYYITARDMALVTVLGSCVAACIYDKKLGMGGMNHFMLPDEATNTSDVLTKSMCYGVHAMEIMINELLKQGAKRSNLEAKVFGGGSVLRGFNVNKVGSTNAAFVIEYLRKENITIAAQDLLDIYPRKIYYFPRSCKVLVKQLREFHNDTILVREKVYSSRIEMANIQGDVELF